MRFILYVLLLVALAVPLGACCADPCADLCDPCDPCAMGSSDVMPCAAPVPVAPGPTGGCGG